MGHALKIHPNCWHNMGYAPSQSSIERTRVGLCEHHQHDRINVAAFTNKAIALKRSHLVQQILKSAWHEESSRSSGEGSHLRKEAKLSSSPLSFSTSSPRPQTVWHTGRERAARAGGHPQEGQAHRPAVRHVLGQSPARGGHKGELTTRQKRFMRTEGLCVEKAVVRGGHKGEITTG
eukprot:scaffold55286_cov17-Tisochrysis_lutea.AAC.2